MPNLTCVRLEIRYTYLKDHILKCIKAFWYVIFLVHTEAYHCLFYINLIRKILKNSGFVLTRLYTDFTLHCRGLYIASLYCRCFGDAGGAGRKFQAPEKMCCIPNKERI